MRYLVGVFMVMVLGVMGVLGLFWVQNMGRTTQLSLDFGLFAWQLAEPIAITNLVGVAFAAGLACGMLPFATLSLRSSRRARRLERELAVAGITKKDPPQV